MTLLNRLSDVLVENVGGGDKVPPSFSMFCLD